MKNSPITAQIMVMLSILSIVVSVFCALLFLCSMIGGWGFGFYVNIFGVIVSIFGGIFGWTFWHGFAEVIWNSYVAAQCNLYSQENKQVTINKRL